MDNSFAVHLCSDAPAAGMRQADLTNWYVGELNEQGAFESLSDMANEYRQVRAIIQVSNS